MAGYVKPELFIFFVVASFGITGGWLAANRGRNFIGWCLLCAIFPIFILVVYFSKPLCEVEGKFKLCPKCHEYIKWNESVCKYCNEVQPVRK